MNLNKQFNVLVSLTSANLKSRYRNTFYGVLWVLLNPILTYLAQVFTFTMIFQGNFPNYPLYLLGGLLPWLFIVQSIDICTGVFLHSAFFLKNIPINPLILPVSLMFDNFINFISAFLILILYFCFSGKLSFAIIPLLILPTLLLFISVTSLAVMFAVINVRYRDLKFVVSFVFTVLFFLTPIFYSLRIVPERFMFFIGNNPLYYLIRPFQELLMNGITNSFFYYLIASSAVALIITVLSMYVWKKMRRDVICYA